MCPGDLNEHSSGMYDSRISFMHMRSLTVSSHHPGGSIGPIPHWMNANGEFPIDLGCFGFGPLKKAVLEVIFRPCLGQTHWEFGSNLEVPLGALIFVC